LISYLQKSIRRNEGENALFIGMELVRSGFPGYVWNRLFTIVFEDVGYTSSHKIILLNELHERYLFLVGKKPLREVWKNLKIVEVLAQAINLLATGEKTRIAAVASVAVMSPELIQEVYNYQENVTLFSIEKEKEKNGGEKGEKKEENR